MVSKRRYDEAYWSMDHPPKEATIGGATMRREDYERIVRRNAERKPARQPVQPAAPKAVAPATDTLDLDPAGRPVGGAATTQPGQWRERVVRIDPFTRPRGPATHHAVQDVVSQMQGSSSPNRTTISSGRDIRARRQVENEQAMIGAYREAGMPLGGIQEMAQEESAERGMARQQATRKEEREYQRGQRELRRQEFLEDVDGAIDLIETTDLPGNATAYMLKNEAVKLQQQRADLKRYAERGGVTEKIRPKVAEIDGRLADIGVRLEKMKEQEQTAQQDAETAAETAAADQQKADAAAELTLKEEKQKAELEIAQYKVQADIAKMDIDAAQEVYKGVLSAEMDVRKELATLESTLEKEQDAYGAQDETDKKEPFVNVWAKPIKALEETLDERKADTKKARKELDEAVNGLKTVMRQSVKLEEPTPSATGGAQRSQQKPGAKRMRVKFEAFPPNMQEWANGELAAYRKAYDKALAAGDGEKVLRIRESIAAVLRKMSVEE